MSLKKQPLPFAKPNYSTNVHVNPLKIMHKVAQKPQQQKRAERKEVAEKQATTNTNASQIARNKQIAKAKQEKTGAYRTKMCPHGRDCKNRTRCRFAHTAQQLRRPFYKRTKPCLLYQRGLCSLGNACRQYHGNFELKNFDQKNYKTTMCQEFQKGGCPLKNICTKAHGQEELEYFRAQAANLVQSIQKQSIQKQEVTDESPKEKIVYQLVRKDGHRKNYTLERVSDPHTQNVEEEEHAGSEEQVDIQKQDDAAGEAEHEPPGDFSFSIPPARDLNH